MKTKKLITVACLACVAVTTQAQTKIVERPPVSMANTRSIEIGKVTLSDTATVVDIEAFYTPGYWIRIVSKSYLRADGKKYMVRRGEGIQLDSLFWMPKSGEASFKLVFDPLPKNTKIFDFIEDDCKSCFKVYGIDLVNKRFELPEIPEEFTRVHQPETDFQMRLEKGEAVISGRLLGYLPEIGDIACVYVDPVTTEEHEMPIHVNSDGSFTSSVTVQSPTTVYLNGVQRIPVRVAPGKESKVIINLFELYRMGSKLHKNTPSYGKKYYYAGYLASLNTDLTHEGLSDAMLHEYTDTIADMDVDSYKKFMMDRYHETVNQNNSLAISPLAKKIVNADATFELFNKLEMADAYLMGAYAKKHNLSRKEAMKHRVEIKRTDDYNDFYRLIPYDDPDILLVPNIHYHIRGLAYCRGNMGDRFDVLRFLSANDSVSVQDRQLLHTYLSAMEKNEPFENKSSLDSIFNKHKGLVTEYMKTKMGEGYLAKVWNTNDAFLLHLVKSMNICSSIQDFNPLTDEQKKILETFPPVIRQIILDENSRLLVRMEENKKKTGFTVLDVPQTANEELFVEMLKPFKGKVVLVDVWATWCGPCRIANKEMEAVKAQFADKDVVFLYLAGENSPENTWRNMIADIKGQHYRVNKSQWDYLRKSLNATGVPTYLIIDREGNRSFHTTGFPGADTMKKELNKALAK